jgi:hypothetical protein
MRATALAAMGRYEPAYYDGSIFLFAAQDQQFGCDPVKLWHGRARRIRVQRIDADHLSIIRLRAPLTAVASGIDHQLNLLRGDWPGLRPANGFARPMIVSTMRWFSSARLAHAMVEAGFEVSACRPALHPMRSVDGLARQYQLSALFPLRSLSRAIQRSAPDILLPDDERAIVLLRRLYERDAPRDPELAALVVRSVGQAHAWPVLSSRAAVAEVARRMHVACPETKVLGSVNAARQWLATSSVPLVLKTDGSWGGCGVAIVNQPEQLNAIWRKVARPPSWLRGIKRLVVNFELDPMRDAMAGRRPVVNGQDFVSGREAIATASCLNGTVTGIACFKVQESAVTHGPAASVCRIRHAGMETAVRAIVSHFGLSGFCGVDFMLTPSGEALVLEINPRITPTCHMLIEGGIRAGENVTLFPRKLVHTLADDPASHGRLDVPIRALPLVRRGERINARCRNNVTSRYRRLQVRLLFTWIFFSA